LFALDNRFQTVTSFSSARTAPTLRSTSKDSTTTESRGFAADATLSEACPIQLSPVRRSTLWLQRTKNASPAVGKAGSAEYAMKASASWTEDSGDGCLLCQAYPCLPQGLSASGGFIRSDARKAGGFLSNTALHPRLQKRWVSPACSEEAAALPGSSGLPQTRSSCAVVDRVASSSCSSSC
jgi:hypothetical protein